MDALLLAAFAAELRPGWRRMADLGCGVGPVAFGAMLLADKGHIGQALGLDFQPELLLAAQENAARLGFAKNFSIEEADFEAPPPGGERLAALAGCFDLVVANPPYRLPGTGRMPPSGVRSKALFAAPANLAAFVRVGAELLSPDGAFCLIFPSGRAEELAALLRNFGLAITRALPLVVREGREPSLLMLSAAKNSFADKEPGVLSQKPLVLYQSKKDGRECLSPAALAFCPFLQCNNLGVCG